MTIKHLVHYYLPNKKPFQNLSDLSAIERRNIVNVLNESNNIIFLKNTIKRKEAITDIRGFLLDCNKDENGKVILKTSTLGRDYIYNKFSIKKIDSEQPKGAWFFVITLNIIGFLGYFILNSYGINLSK